MKTPKTFLLTLIVGLALPAALHAQEIPETMGYAGELSRDGERFTGTVGVTFSLHDAPVAGDEVWSESQSLAVVAGALRAELGGAEPLAGVFDGAPLWLELTVDGQALSPRTFVGSQPYAWRASVAGDAATLGGNSVQDILGQVPAPTSATVPFDDAAAGLGQATSQGAIEELARRLAALEQTMTSQQTELAQARMDLSTARSDITALTGDLMAANTRITTLEADVMANTTSVGAQGMLIAANSSALAARGMDITALQADVADHTTDISSLQTKTQDITRTTIRGRAAVIFDSVNVHIRSGQGATNGLPQTPNSITSGQVTTNGLGNLIIGYDENVGGSTPPPKTGSHNLVMGPYNSYSSFGGIVSGQRNEISAPYASAFSGFQNTSSGVYSAVLSGVGNEASDFVATVTGGTSNTASAVGASVSGGTDNAASGQYSSVMGGSFNTASASAGSVVGGRDNEAWSSNSAILGGQNNTTQPVSSTNRALGFYAAVVGGFSNRSASRHAVVVGGRTNSATGLSSVVSGGQSRSVTGADDWRAGLSFQTN